MILEHNRHEFTPSELAHICIVGDCTMWTQSRGLCYFHYRKAYKAVRAGLFTWNELVELGAALPTKRHPTK